MAFAHGLGSRFAMLFIHHEIGVYSTIGREVLQNEVRADGNDESTWKRKDDTSANCRGAGPTSQVVGGIGR